MRDRRQLAIESAVVECPQEIFLVEIVGDVAIDQIDELAALFKIVDREYLVLAARP
jgi:hypothetical protein